MPAFGRANRRPARRRNCIHRRRGNVQLRATRHADQWRIDVADCGLGIEPADLPKLFKPFQRGAHARSTIEGTGIGLAVSQSLVELMGGRIAVSGIAGDGSVFNVILSA